MDFEWFSQSFVSDYGSEVLETEQAVEMLLAPHSWFC